MSKKNRILVLGNFGYITGQIDGQTVKTRTIYELLKTHSKEKVEYFDTQAVQLNKKNVWKMALEVVRCRKLVYMPAHYNFKYFFPYIFYLSRIFNFKIYYFIVGGWLAEYTRERKKHIECLKRIEGLFSETVKLKTDLEQLYGLKQVHLFPNFRIHSYIPPAFSNDNDSLRLVYMSRIMIRKGIDVLFRLMKFVQREGLSDRISIYFYGPIYKPEEPDFLEGLSRFDNASYKGVINPDHVYATLSENDVLVLPTRYEGEGFPGAILDAYISGIPVIASDWKYNGEFVEHGKTGFLFPLDNEQIFYRQVLSLLNDKDQLMRFKLAARQKSKQYDSESCWTIIKEQLNLN